MLITLDNPFKVTILKVKKYIILLKFLYIFPHLYFFYFSSSCKINTMQKKIKRFSTELCMLLTEIIYDKCMYYWFILYDMYM